jgi:DNA polymerase elongation subunit (family B)
MKLEIIANNVGMANVCSVPMSWIFMRGQGVKIFSLVAKECKERGFLVPTIAKQNMVKKAEDDDGVVKEEEEGYEGAIVLEPKTGIYIDTPVSVFDYASLYPSSMISENLSHDCIVLDEKYDNLPNVEYLDISYDLYEQCGDEKKKVGEKVCRFMQPPNGEKGIIPNILMHLLKNRKLTRKKIGMKRVILKDGTQYEGFHQKGQGVIFDLNGVKSEFNEDDINTVEDVYNSFQKAVLDGLQLAYKITANSLYGQIGAKTSPIYLKDIAACTTATGRKMIMLAKDFMEKEYKAEIVYGDSVTGDTPLLIRYPTGIVDICTIETLCEKWDKYERFVKKGTQKEQGFVHAQVWANGNWANIKRVIRHRTQKKMYRVNTFRGCVDVTEDHSLVGINGDKVCPGELTVGETEIKHTFPGEFEEIDIPMKAFDVGNDSHIYELYPDKYECTKCGEEFGIEMYYTSKTRDNRKSTQCRLCIKKRDCNRTGKEFSGKLNIKVLKYKTEEYTINKFEAWVWGFFFGDGSCGDYKCKSGDKKSWAINNSNLEYLEKAKKHLELVENADIVNFKVLDTLKSSGVYKLVASGSVKYMVEKYRELFYDKDNYKKVPAIILNASQEVRFWFMRGYLTADGGKGDMAKGSWTFACKGKIGAQGLFYLMKSLGWRNIRVNINPNKENTYWISNLTNTHYLKKWDNKVMKIQELPDTDETHFVYDIETEDGVFHGGVGEVQLFNTDSIFATFPTEVSGLYGKEALKKTLEISIEASDKIKPLLKAPHDLEWEKAFFPMILFSKKRYCANKYEHDINKFKQVSMGIVLKRRDNANIVKKIYGGIIDIILNKHDVKQSIQFLKDSLDDLINGKYPIDDLVITKTLKARYKDPDKIAHKMLAERIKERSPGSAPQVNDRIPFAYIDLGDTKGKVLQGERIEHPEYITEKKLKLDYEFYLTNQIMNPVLQLYALIVEQLEGYRLPQDHWVKIKKSLEADGKSEKKVRERLAELREQEAKKLLFDPILIKLKHKKSGQTQITSFFTYVTK